jgi:hypothetical protein
MNQPKPDYWTNYLDKTLFAPAPAAITFGPAVVLFMFGLVFWNVGSIPALFIAWAWLGVADVICVWREPVRFGLKLWFPPLPESAASLALVRSFFMADLTLSAPRAAFGIWPQSPVLFGLAALTAVVQFIWTVREYRYRTIDIRVLNIAASGPVILAILLVIHAVQGGVSWTRLP